MAKSSDGGEFMAAMRADHPEFLLRSYTGVRNYVADNFRPTLPPYVPDFPANSFLVPQEVMVWYQANVVGHPIRPKSLILRGPTRTGKSQMARSFGHHIYLQTWINWDRWDDSATYVVVDDVAWESFNKSGYKKVLLGCQTDFQVNPKCKGLRSIAGGLPCIYVSNEHFVLEEWDVGNCDIVDIRSPLWT